MHRTVLSLAFLVMSLCSVSAESIYPAYGSGSQYFIEGDKAYKVVSSYTTGETKLEQYSFPSLELQETIVISSNFNTYIDSIQTASSGILVSTTSYSTDYEDLGNATTGVTITNTTTVKSYDSSLSLVATKITEDTYSYEYYDYYTANVCPDDRINKAVLDNLRARKKSGKGSRANTESCSKIKAIKSTIK